MPYKLDVKDRKILAELDRNARQANSEIGKKVGLSKEVVKYRIDKLIENIIILRFHTLINYFKLGISKHKLYLRLTNVNKEKLEEIAQYFKNHKRTEWVVIASGRWDMMIGFLVHNVNELDDEIQIVLNKFAPYIQEKAVSTTLYLVHHERAFLRRGSEISKVVYHTAKDKQEKIDKVDENILKIITNNARTPVTEIAKRLKTTPRIVQYRLRDMEKKQIILAYKAHLEPRAMGRIFCKAIIYLTNITKDKLSRFMSYASSLPGAVWPQRVLSNWDFEIDFELESYDQFQDILLKIKEKYPDIIRSHDFCIVSKEFKLDLFPGCEPQFR